MSRLSRVLFPDEANEADSSLLPSNAIERTERKKGRCIEPRVSTTRLQSTNSNNTFIMGDSLGRLGTLEVIPIIETNQMKQEHHCKSRKRRRGEKDKKELIGGDQCDKENNPGKDCSNKTKFNVKVAEDCYTNASIGSKRIRSRRCSRVHEEVMDVLGNLCSLPLPNSSKINQSSNSKQKKKPKPKQKRKQKQKKRKKKKESSSGNIINTKMAETVVGTVQTANKEIKENDVVCITIEKNQSINDDEESNTVVCPISPLTPESKIKGILYQVSDEVNRKLTEDVLLHSNRLATQNKQLSVSEHEEKDACLLSPSIAPITCKRVDVKATPTQSQHEVDSDKTMERLEDITWYSLSSTIYKKRKRASKSLLSESVKKSVTSELKVSPEPCSSELEAGYDTEYFTPIGEVANSTSVCVSGFTDLAPTKSYLPMQERNVVSEHDDPVKYVEKSAISVGDDKGTTSTQSCLSNVGTSCLAVLSSPADKMKEFVIKIVDDTMDETLSKSCSLDSLSEGKDRMDKSHTQSCSSYAEKSYKTERSSPLSHKKNMLDDIPTESLSSNIQNSSITECSCLVEKKKKLIPDGDDGVNSSSNMEDITLRRSSRCHRPIERLALSFRRKAKQSKSSRNKDEKVISYGGQNQIEQNAKSMSKDLLNVDKDNKILEVIPVRKSKRERKPVERLVVKFRRSRKKVRTLPKKCKDAGLNEGKNGKKDLVANSSFHNDSGSNEEVAPKLNDVKRNASENASDIKIKNATQYTDSHHVIISDNHNDQLLSNEWDGASLKLLMQAHTECDPKSFSFWHQIASRVPNKSAEQCQEKWFALVITPKIRRKKKDATEDVSLSLIHKDDVDDDIFNSTPVRNAAKLMLSLHKSTSRRKRQKVESSHERQLSDTFSSPIVNEYFFQCKDDTGYLESIQSPLRFQQMNKVYLNKVRAGFKDKTQKHSKQHSNIINKGQKKQKHLSAAVDAGDVHMNGALSPNGTLRVNAPDEYEAEDMYIPSDVGSCCEEII